MSSTRKALVFIVLLSLAALLAHIVLRNPGRKIDFTSFETIKEGMTRAEVESLFGVPPGRYVGLLFPRIDERLFPCVFKMWREEAASYQLTWMSEYARITVGFSEQGKVIASSFTKIEIAGTYDRLQLFFGFKKYPL
jgi:hypothetical protein